MRKVLRSTREEGVVLHEGGSEVRFYGKFNNLNWRMHRNSLSKEIEQRSFFAVMCESTEHFWRTWFVWWDWTVVAWWKDKAEGWVRPDGRVLSVMLRKCALYPAGTRRGVQMGSDLITPCVLETSLWWQWRMNKRDDRVIGRAVRKCSMV